MSSERSAARAAASATTPWWSLEFASLSSSPRSSNRTGTPCLRASCNDFFDARILPPFRNGNPVNRPLRLQRLLHGMYPCQAVHGGDSFTGECPEWKAAPQ